MVDQVCIYLFILNHMNKLFLHSVNLNDCIISVRVYIYVYIPVDNGVLSFFVCGTRRIEMAMKLKKKYFLRVVRSLFFQ